MHLHTTIINFNENAILLEKNRWPSKGRRRTEEVFIYFFYISICCLLITQKTTKNILKYFATCDLVNQLSTNDNIQQGSKN